MDNKLKVFRAMHDLTQQELAEAISVSRQTIHSIEKNRYVPSTLLALKIARKVQARVEEIFILDEND